MINKFKNFFNKKNNISTNIKQIKDFNVGEFNN